MNKSILILLFLFTFCLVFLHIQKNENKGILKTNNQKREISQQEYKKIFRNCFEKFSSEQFENAAICFEDLINKYDSPNAKLLYGISLGYSKKYSEAITVLEEVKNDQNTNEEIKKDAQEAYILFSKEKKNSEIFDRNDKGNYFGDITNYAIWENPRAIKVYIYDDFNKKNEMYNAFDTWDSMLRSVVDFIYVDSPQDADITAKAVDINNLPGRRVGQTKSFHKYYLYDKSNLYMHKANIEVSYNNVSNIAWSEKEFQGIVLHEIGHALGIMDHSSHRGDIMYFDTSSYRNGTVSNRDVNTIKLLYGDLSN